MKASKTIKERESSPAQVSSAGYVAGSKELGSSTFMPPTLQLAPDDEETEQQPSGFFSALSSYIPPIFSFGEAVNEKIEQSDDTAEGVGGLYDYLTAPAESAGSGEGGEDGGSIFGWLSKPFGYIAATKNVAEGDFSTVEGGGKRLGGLSDIASKVSDDAGLDKMTGLPLKDAFGVLKGGGAIMEGAGKLKSYYKSKQDADVLKGKLGKDGDDFYTKNAIEKNFVDEDAWGEGVEKIALGGTDIASTLTGGVGGGVMKAGKAAYESGIGSWMLRGIGSYLAPDLIDSNKRHEKDEKEQGARKKFAKGYLIQHEILLGKPTNVVEMYKAAPEDSKIRKQILKEINTVRNFKNKQEIQNKKEIKNLIGK